MTLSIGPATDYLYGLAQQSVDGVTVAEKPAKAFDGPPGALVPGMFVIGLEQIPPDATGDTAGTRMWSGLGAMKLEEDYVIPCVIDCRLAGTQKQARDAAEGIFNTFWPLLKADLTLGGVLSGGRYAEIVNLTSTPMAVGTEGEPGRRQVVVFGVHCKNQTI